MVTDTEHTCAGSVNGDGTLSGGAFKGMAPESHLLFHAKAGCEWKPTLLGIPNDLDDMFALQQKTVPWFTLTPGDQQ